MKVRVFITNPETQYASAWWGDEPRTERGRVLPYVQFEGDPSEVEIEVARHRRIGFDRAWPRTIGKCGFCGGPTPCTRED